MFLSLSVVLSDQYSVSLCWKFCKKSTRRRNCQHLLRSASASVQVQVASGGSKPSGYVHPMAISVMKEIGEDISNHQSKHWNTLPASFLKSVTHLISLCAEESCPYVSFPTAQHIHWQLPDPAKEPCLPVFREIRDQLLVLLTHFFQSSGIAISAPTAAAASSLSSSASHSFA